MAASRRSQRALDWLNFFVADVQTGFGPFVAVYLAAQEWTQAQIGFALSVGAFTAMVSQVPAGALVDATPKKRLAALAALLAVAASALLLAAWPATLPVLLSEVLHGFASCVLAPPSRRSASPSSGAGRWASGSAATRATGRSATGSPPASSAPRAPTSPAPRSSG